MHCYVFYTAYHINSDVDAYYYALKEGQTEKLIISSLIVSISERGKFIAGINNPIRIIQVSPGRIGGLVYSEEVY